MRFISGQSFSPALTKRAGEESLKVFLKAAPNPLKGAKHKRFCL
jgi:hypothetical protein